VDYVGRGELSVRQQNLGQMLSKLMKLAEEFNVAVLYTNQVMSNPDGGMSFVSDPKKPVGGHVLAHASTTRLELKKVFCCLLFLLSSYLCIYSCNCCYLSPPLALAFAPGPTASIASFCSPGSCSRRCRRKKRPCTHSVID
jgi:hypothetical protein